MKASEARTISLSRHEAESTKELQTIREAIKDTAEKGLHSIIIFNRPLEIVKSTLKLDGYTVTEQEGNQYVKYECEIRW